MSYQISLSRDKSLDGAIISGSLESKYSTKIDKCQERGKDEPSPQTI